MFQAGLVSLAVFLAAVSRTAAIPDEVQLLGRVAEDNGSELFTWPYSGVQFSFTGTAANVTFTTTGSTSFSISVDGSEPQRIDSPVVSTGVLADGEHEVVVLKITEANTGTASLADNGIVTNGELIASTPSERRIEFVGDSITAGYGVDGVNPCSFSAATENAGHSYAAYTAEALDAEASLIAWSGRGVTRNYPNSDGSSPDPTMPTLWLQTSALDATATYDFPESEDPQAVVIALGTNDFAYYNLNRDAITLDAFQSGVQNFVNQVFDKYPSTTVFLASSPMLSDGYPPDQNQKTTQETAFRNVANATENVVVVSIPSQGSDVGCDYHPTAATQQADADVLVAAIKEQLGW